MKKSNAFGIIETKEHTYYRTNNGYFYMTVQGHGSVRISKEHYENVKAYYGGYIVIITYKRMSNDAFHFNTLEMAQDVYNKLKNNSAETAVELWQTDGQHIMTMIDRVDKR